MKLQIELFGFFCYLSFCACCISPALEHLFIGSHAKFNLSVAYLDSAQLIRQKGYPSETHTIQTKDGYLLSMHRIPHGIRGNNTATKGPIFLQHGFFGQSIDWLLLKPEKDLAFMLADAGYDVWLGNFRGNTYSRAHISLTPCDNEFWDFTWHESGLYDLSAMIDFVLETTKAEKLEYVGHSMGTTGFFVLMSMHPEYNEKISKAHLLAPIAFIKHIKSPLIQATAHLSGVYKMFADIFASGALLPNNDLYRLLRELACDVVSKQRKICYEATFLIAGADSKEFDEDLMGSLAYHYPAGYSVKALNHYSQLFLSGGFREYDYGHAKNMEHYGSPVPPSYNLKKVTAPIVLYVGLNDYLSTLEDVKKLSKFLPNLKELYIVKFSRFNHLDFIFAIDAKTLLYDEIMQRLSADCK